MYVVALAPTPHRAAYVALMSTRPTVGSPARGAMKRTVSFPNTDRAEAGYGSVPGTGDDEPSTSSGWTTMPLVAGRLLLTIAVFGVLGSLLPFFAVGWANKLGNAPGFVKKTGGSVSGLQMLQSMPVVSLGQAPGDANLLGTQLKPCSSEDQASTTGWHRNGSCTWNPDDGGYHEVRLVFRGGSRPMASSVVSSSRRLPHPSVMTH